MKPIHLKDFFYSDIHKATEEIASVNNTKIEKIRLHLIEVGSVLCRGGYQQLIKICFVLVSCYFSLYGVVRFRF